MTRIFRNADGVLAVERDGILVYGPTKVYRAVDVRIEEKPNEHWIALPNTEWTKSIEPGLLAAVGALRFETVVNGQAAVFMTPSFVTEASLRVSIAAYTPPKNDVTLARERLLAWKTGGTQPRRDEVVDILTMMGV